MARLVRLSTHRKARRPAPVFFNRGDLNLLLAVYSQRVARAEWRDYAIGHEPGLAIFAVFRHAHETPLYTITKRLQGGKPLYAVHDSHRKLRQSARLEDALAVLATPLRLVSR